MNQRVWIVRNNTQIVNLMRKAMPIILHLPRPLKPREEAGAFRVILDHDIDLDLTEYFTESEDKDLDNAEWLMKYTQFPCPSPSKHTEEVIYYSDREEDV